jgi:predicted methyltransferase
MRSAACVAVLLAGGLTAATVTTLAASSGKIPAYIQAAVDDTARPDADRQRDAHRKPAEVLAFAGIKPGQKVGELLPGGGYYTRLLCRVVGDSGQVYTISFKMTRTFNRPPPPTDGHPCSNITASTTSADDPMLPSDLDVVWTTENYHDLHNDLFGKPDMKAFDTAVFKALKPGGEYIIEDHVAESGSGARDTDTLHRIDPALVKQEVTSAGFKYVGESHVLHNAEDKHTEKVFALKGATDRFLLKFRKPRS